ncbi:PAS domain S-box protein [Pantanalinema sp. GBBB05]|uniref:hybrid sensor histidine kinase/response regulator n=1 Tax=Pantanalinema sp. GBBB05 TaxID=2604139 RepID=UPI003D817231
MKARRKPESNRLLHGGIAVLSVAVALGLTLLLEPWLYPTVTPFFFVAVIVSAGVGGWEAGLLATVLSTLAVHYCFIEPRSLWSIVQVGTGVRLGLFAITAALTSWLDHSRRMALNRARADYQALKETIEREEGARIKRQQAEEALRQSEDRFHAVAANLPKGAVFILDRDWCYLLAAGEALQAAGMRSEDLVGKTIWEALDPALAKNYEPNLRQALSGTPFSLEHESHGSSYISHGTPLYDDRGDIYAVLVMSYDISDRKQAEAQLRRVANLDTFRVALLDALRLVGALCVTESQPRLWSETEIELVRETADRLWAAIERTRAEAALRKSEEKYRSLFESIDEGFNLLEMMLDEAGNPYDFRIVETNPAWEQQTGLADATGKTLLEIAPTFERQWIDFYSNVVFSGKAARTEYYTEPVQRWYNVFASRVGGAGSRQIAVVFNDITDRKRREANLAFLAEIQTDCARLTTVAEMMQTVGAKIGSYLNLSICAFVDVDEAHDRAIVYHTWHREDAPNLMGTYRISEFVTEAFYRAARAGEIVIINDTNTDARTNAENCAALNVQAFIHVPFLHDGQWKFLFNGYDSRPRQWREDEIEVFRELANQIFPRLERARAEEALRHSESRFRLMVESAKEYAIFTLDLNGVVTGWNAGAERLLGYLEAEIVGCSGRIIFTPEDQEQGRHERELQLALTQGRAENERWHVRQDGSRFWGSGIVMPLQDEAGNVQGFVKIMQDKTTQRQTQAEREQLLHREQAARETAETANRIKDEFLAVLSHELRSPLNPILGWAKLLKAGNLDAAKTAQAITTIERNAKLQSELIEDLLDVSRILQGKLSLNASPVDLAVTIRGAIETVRLAAEAKSITVEANLDAVEPVSGDATRLQQVVWNLLSNAVKFTPTGGRVEVRLEPVDHQAQITVSDTGKGIPANFLPYVFDYFRQEDGATTRQFGGLGLGLAIVRHLVELHGGTVAVASAGEGLGATFTVNLPLLRTEDRGLKTENLALSTQHSALKPLEGLQILVIDDETDSREFVAFVLEQAGANVTTATTASEGFVALTQSSPDVLISDIGMPDLDGYMLMRQVRSLPPEQGGWVKAIALTAYAGDFNQQQALQAGFQQHVSKPVEPEELVRAISTLLTG